MKSLAFLQEDFHSEVLDFLFELISINYPDTQLILYNNTDRYNNKEFYKLKYPKLIIKYLQDFLPDFINNVFDKCFVISYDNIISLYFLIKYKHKFIFIAHSDHHIKLLENYNLNYFSLTPLLSNNFMLPIIKTPNLQLNNITEISQNNIDGLNTVRNISQQDNLTIIITIGHYSNRDLQLIEDLLNSKKILLLSFIQENYTEFVNLLNKHSGYLFPAYKFSTNQIQYIINYLNIKYLLFAPHPDSQFYKTSWSGSIAFSINNNINLIMPKKLSDYYNFTTPSIISYNQTSDIIDNLQLYKSNDDLQVLRNRIWENNSEFIHGLLN